VSCKPFMSLAHTGCERHTSPWWCSYPGRVHSCDGASSSCTSTCWASEQGVAAIWLCLIWPLQGLSTAAKELLVWMLKETPLQRPTAQQVLHHRWTQVWSIHRILATSTMSRSVYYFQHIVYFLMNGWWPAYTLGVVHPHQGQLAWDLGCSCAAAAAAAGGGSISAVL